MAVFFPKVYPADLVLQATLRNSVELDARLISMPTIFLDRGCSDFQSLHAIRVGYSPY